MQDSEIITLDENSRLYYSVSFFKPQPLSQCQTKIQRVTFKLTEEVTRFILSTVGSGGATNWLTGLVFDFSAFCYQQNHDVDDAAVDNWRYWITTAFGLTAFSIATAHYLYERLSSYSCTNIDASITSSIRQTCTLVTKKNDSDSGKLFAQRLVQLATLLHLCDYKEKINLLYGLQQIEDVIRQNSVLLTQETKFAEIIKHFNTQLNEFLKQHELTKIVDLAENKSENTDLKFTN